MAINLGNITFGLAANVQQLASAGQAVLTFGANVARTITYLNSFGKASQQATGAAQGLGEIGRAHV